MRSPVCLHGQPAGQGWCVHAQAGACRCARRGPIGAGEQLCVAYVGVMEPRRVRARDLSDSKHFTCACARCTEPLAASTDLCLEVCGCDLLYCKRKFCTI